MPTRSVELTEHQEHMIETLGRSGRYRNADEVLGDALRLIEQREAEDVARLEALRRAAGEGMKAFERGDYRAFESFDDIEHHLAEAANRDTAEP